ncbi:hypothetical protein C7380_108143 [Oceanotoga teriensis]|uniref:Uncharacterized protein n=1 Tax=Oceanotoga teriensis TaxID=515440 RepID=A0AA45HIN4_9BACT|nr:hypothetical protein [Oceanotoga teriensis]PWJ93313.1 hypothetical protein C7380_108143 [Oceanotoga teriensis]
MNQVNSTFEDDSIPRGLGLPTVRDFILLNEGKMQIYSNNSILSISGKNITFENINFNMPGTIISLNIKSDSSHIYDIVT